MPIPPIEEPSARGAGGDKNHATREVDVRPLPVVIVFPPPLRPPSIPYLPLPLFFSEPSECDELA